MSSVHSDLALPPSISVLTRSESTPSNVSDGSTFVAPSPSLSAIDIEDEDDLPGIKSELGLPQKNASNMNGSRPPMAGEWKARALSGSDGRSAVVMPRPAPTRGRQSAPVVPSRPAPQAAKQKGGFAALIRRLTGRSAPSSKNKVARPPSIIAEKSIPPVRARSISRDVRGGIPNKQQLQPLNVKIHSDYRGPLSAPAAIHSGSVLVASAPISAPTPSVPRPTDPCEIPLPPSPLVEGSSVQEDSLDVIPEIALLTDSNEPADAINVVSSDRSKENLNSLKESDEEEEEEGAEIEASEQKDKLRELQPIRIPSGGSRSNAPDTPATVSSALEEIITPTSLSGSSPPDREYRMAGSSPPRKAPIGVGSELGRKESKWRRSVMGLSDIAGSKKNNRNSTMRSSSAEGRISSRQPPTSYDAYLAQQARIANNRVSCQPTLHSQASIAAELRQIRDQDEKDMAEVFFLS